MGENPVHQILSGIDTHERSVLETNKTRRAGLIYFGQSLQRIL